jgi:hypothetical protein
VIQWFNKYVFRGVGMMMLIAIVTILYLAVQSMRTATR